MLFLAFQVLPVLMAVGFVVAVAVSSGTRNAVIAAVFSVVWLGGTALLAHNGVLADFDPPRLPLLLLVILAMLVWASRLGWGSGLRSLPLGLLVGFQGFRILVELGIHQAAVDGIAPVEMSWSGWNFDIVTGVSAVLLAPFAKRVPVWALHVWNVACLGLLFVVVGTGILSMPTPFQQIVTDPPNTWIASFPYVWLPCVHVALAWLGHLMLFQRLCSARP
ncbi:MAG: hypothetical protein GY913_34655 [Proteobacteria bacterium]|nr:hypothetical protein [Pseudomonadota bacterium]MCP4922072.1 hypothetical protein [Pseudomonadota bacterium]